MDNEVFRYNVNHKIKVKLTEYGKAILEKDVTDTLGMLKNFNYKEYSLYHEDEDGYATFQLWDFMSIFGSYFCPGCSLIIEHNEIIFIDEF